MARLARFYPDTLIRLPSVVIVVGKFCEDDYQYYFEWLKILCKQEKVEIWARYSQSRWCLCTNRYQLSRRTYCPYTEWQCLCC